MGYFLFLPSFYTPALLLAHLQRLYLMDLHLQLDRQDATGDRVYFGRKKAARERKESLLGAAMVAKEGIAGPI